MILWSQAIPIDASRTALFHLSSSNKTNKNLLIKKHVRHHELLSVLITLSSHFECEVENVYCSLERQLEA